MWWIGAGGLLLVLVGAVVRMRSSRRWLNVVASVMVLAGWAVVAQFLLKHLVPKPVVVAVLLGGITVAILASAVIGTRRARREK